MSRPDQYVPVAVTSRSGLDESVHFGAVVALAADGSVELAAGDPGVVVYPRSSNKPMQAVAMVRAGLSLPAAELALVCASHDGTPAHVDAARRILAVAGLDEGALRNTPDLPLDVGSQHALIRAGEPKRPIYMNCSGKHSGMVATCACNGWDVPGYLDVDHPLQRRITDTIAELTGEPPAHIGVDGCGAPAHACSLLGLARGFRTIATADDPACRSVREAMVAHPEVVGGERRDVTLLMRHVPGLFAKDGAEGVFAAALPDGRTVALKVADGASRARPPVMLAALERLGVDVAAAAVAVVQPVLGHGHRVGEVRAVLA